MSSELFVGCGTALVTPFKKDGSFDETTFRSLVRRQVSEGIDFLVPCGTTGESPTLSHEEKLAVVNATVEESGGKPVLAGAGGYNTHEVIDLIQEYKSLGVHGILSVTPFYNKPTQEGLIAHYKAISDSTDLPIVVYSVLPRTNVNVEPATMAKLAEMPNIVGVKEASGILSQVASIIHRVPRNFKVLSGDDSVTLPVVSLGGHGVISVVSNQIPKQMTEMARLAINGDFKGAQAIQRKYQALFEINFVEANPQPVKVSMEMMGLLENNLRLPLIPCCASSVEKIRNVMVEAGLL